MIELIEKARKRAVELGLPYRGALSPIEAERLRNSHLDAKLVDVRTVPERVFVGRIEDAIEIEWVLYPDGAKNAFFFQELDAFVSKDTLLLFICRSGARSHDAAMAAPGFGYDSSFNVLSGFEGDLDANGQRNSLNGWKKSGLPWYQS